MTVLRGPSPAPTVPPHPEGGGTVLRAVRLFLPPMAAGTRPVLHTVVIDVLAVVERDLGAHVRGLFGLERFPDRSPTLTHAGGPYADSTDLAT